MLLFSTARCVLQSQEIRNRDEAWNNHNPATL